MSNVVCFGEVLWDLFPTHKVIGGAPLNVTLRLHSFGVDTNIISRIGKDNNGENVLKYLRECKINTSYIQVDDILPTGFVSVNLDENGSATYNITKPVAWDNINTNETNTELVSDSNILIFGSLICRSQDSKETLFSLLEHANFSIFDVNLRKPHYTLEVVTKLMNKADFIKLNHEELTDISMGLGFSCMELKEQIIFLSKKTKTNSICVTLGSDGAILYVDNKFIVNRGYKITVRDTVGAGDSFLASLVFKLYIENKTPENSLDFACRIGALVASKSGANASVLSKEIISLNANLY